MSKKIIDLLNGLQEQFVTHVFGSAATSLTAGTPGTLATYQTIDVEKEGYTPIGVVGLSVSHGSSYHPEASLNGSTLYLNFYRAMSSAYSVPAKDVFVTILYKKA